MSFSSRLKEKEEQDFKSRENTKTRRPYSEQQEGAFSRRLEQKEREPKEMIVPQQEKNSSFLVQPRVAKSDNKRAWQDRKSVV